MKPNVAARPVPSDPHLNHAHRGGATEGLPQPIDLVYLTRQTFGDKRLETELLRLFMRQSQQIEGSLETSGEDGHSVSTVELLHMLSGSARAIGATDVAAMATGFEAEMRRGEKAVLSEDERAGLGDLITQTNLYIRELLEQM